MLVVDAAGDSPRGAGEADVRTWREGVARLEDPYVAVEALRGGP